MTAFSAKYGVAYANPSDPAFVRYEVVPEHARVTAPDEHPENDVKPAARRPTLI